MHTIKRAPALVAGGRIVGTTNVEEMGLSGGSFSCVNGPVRNPHDKTRQAGGSSSGSAVLVGLELSIKFVEETELRRNFVGDNCCQQFSLPTAFSTLCSVPCYQVATGEVDMALGGDQGGSIRIPSSWCGIVGKVV